MSDCEESDDGSCYQEVFEFEIPLHLLDGPVELLIPPIRNLEDLISKCQFCFKKFITKAELSEHLRTAHDLEKPFACRRCSRSFELKATLMAHIKNVHVVACQKCSKKFTKVENLAKHMQEAHPAGMKDPVDPESDEGSDETENVNPNIPARTGLVIALKRKWTNESFQRAYELIASQVEL